MGGLFGGGGGGSNATVPPPPPPKPVVPMPDDESPLVLEAKRRKTAEILARSGRASTLLSGAGSDNATGNSDYSGKTLGG